MPRLRAAAILPVLALAAVSASAQPRADLLGDGIVRFTDAGVAADGLHPSVALVAPPEPLGPAPDGLRVVPEFFETEEGREGFAITVAPGTSLYGTGEVAGPLLRNGRVIECWNHDAYGYDARTPHLYQSHPWVLAVRPDGSAFGVLADTTFRTWIDLTSGITMTADGPDFAVIVIDRTSPQDVVTTLADLTGKIEMPPLWALGYHQCRYSYAPESRVREVASGFRERSIPADVVWMDIDYMNGYRVFTFDPVGFPDPRRLNTDLHTMGFRSVWMLDPGVKLDESDSVYRQGTERGAWVETAAGEPYVGDVWPGPCVFPDFTSGSVRDWWSGLVEDFVLLGIDGVWNDMNEPAVFNVDGKTMPAGNVHRADAALGGPGPHAKYHNIYGMQMARATREGFMRAYPNRRPFVLSRANFLGGQRYAATWSGDNTAAWDHLEWSVPMVINLGLSGNPFTGPDIGGFVGDGDGELFARWMGVGALLPFARGHTGKENVDKEPWAFGPGVEATCRRALERRYRLIPYLYTLFREAHDTGMPIVRPLFFLDPADPALRSEDDAFLLGGDVLVVPALTQEGDRAPALPRDFGAAWRALDFGDAGDPDLPRLYARAGSIVPTGPVEQHTGERPLDPLELVVALDDSGSARGTLYEDFGDGWEFRDGEYRLTTYEAVAEADAVYVRATRRDGRWNAPQRALRVRLLMRDGTELRASGRENEDIVLRTPG
ncbi:MAG TPA: TIM-barrel domain-containing protein [Phycisphaerales bacterium]|nr:TIM-barrel domain-containing protein [Phycisphaerales bacterium]